jgi:hypothetical protein
MATFAVIKDGIVTNLIIAETLEIAEMVTEQTCVEKTTDQLISIGWTYDGTVFAEPTA